MTTIESDQQARLAALYEVSSRLGTTLDLQELLNLVMDSIIQLTGAERGYLILLNGSTGQHHTVAARKVEQDISTNGSSQISDGIITRAIESGESILADNAQADERFSRYKSVVGNQLRSIMCTPLRARGRVIGAAYVDNRLLSGVFQNADLELLEAFASQAAIAIDNARLFTQADQKLARRVKELTLFQQIDRELNKSLDLDRALGLALDWAIKLTDADNGSVGLIQTLEDDSGQSKTVLRLLAHLGDETRTRLEVPLSHPIVAQALQGKRPVRTKETTEAESIDGSASAVQLAVPITHEGEMTGLIVLESQAKAAFQHSEDIASVTRLADRAAVAIHNARLYEAIAAANQAKSQFISLVTHELRIPLTNIKGYTDLMAMVDPLSERQEQFLKVVRRNLSRMTDLISDLSDINRIESGRMRFELEPIQIDQVVEDVATSMQEAIDRKNLLLSICIPDSMPPVYADPSRITQVLSNLVNNAYKYTPEGGRLQIATLVQPGFVRVSVSDNGIGIKAEDQARLFSQFFRSDDEAVRDQPGWGLGLSIVKMIVEAHGGDTGFDSQYGRGSTFWFTVPVATTDENV